MWKIIKYIAIAIVIGLVVWGFKIIVEQGNEVKSNSDLGIAKDLPVRR